MDVQLKELIDKIKNDGVKSAEENAARIIAEAEEQASVILRKAQNDADTLKETARADAEKSERSGREALRQAGRDLVLTVRGEIEALFGKVIEAETAKVLDGSMMSKAVSAAVNALAQPDAGDFEVLLPPEVLSGVESGLKANLATAMAAGLEIKPFKGLDAGFRISRKDGSAFYDFSEQELAAMLSRYLNPRLAALLTD